MLLAKAMRQQSRWLLLSVLCLLTFSFARGQKENVQWYCSGDSKIDFSSGSPILSYQGVLPGSSNPESATYSDRLTGRLMFFSDGNTVWNRALVPMPHGSPLGGDITNEIRMPVDVLIVPMPGSQSKFLIFSVEISNTSSWPMLGWAVYSIVDMSLDSGRGDVIAHDAILAGGTAIAGLGAT